MILIDGDGTLPGGESADWASFEAAFEEAAGSPPCAVLATNSSVRLPMRIRSGIISIQMRICAAQTQPIKGDIQSNLANHKALIRQAVYDGAEMIMFPELSLTGYEPTLARDLAMDEADTRLDDFQALSDANGITIGVGAPTIILSSEGWVMDGMHRVAKAFIEGLKCIRAVQFPETPAPDECVESELVSPLPTS